MSCVDGQYAGLIGGLYAVGGLFGLNNFITDPVSKDSVKELQDQIDENYKQMEEKINDIKYKSTQDKIDLAEAHLCEYKDSQAVINEIFDEKIQTAFVLIYGLIFCVIVMYIYLLIKT